MNKVSRARSSFADSRSDKGTLFDVAFNAAFTTLVAVEAAATGTVSNSTKHARAFESHIFVTLNPAACTPFDATRAEATGDGLTDLCKIKIQPNVSVGSVFSCAKLKRVTRET